MKNELSPVALFAFNRPAHLMRALESLQANYLASGTRLFIFCDGSRGPQDDEGTKQVREICNSVSGFMSTEVLVRPFNAGLAKSVIEGVSSICNRFGKVIVLEDDLVTSPHFLQFMNDGLDCYSGNSDVLSIGAYSPVTKRRLPETYFLNQAECWGWATWKRSWDLLELDGRKLKERILLANRSDEFDLEGCTFNMSMLDSQINRKNDSWWILWNATCFINNKLTLYPRVSLTANIGFDGSGTHCGVFQTDVPIGSLSNRRIQVLPQPTVVSNAARNARKYKNRSCFRIAARELRRFALRVIQFRKK